MKFDFKEEDLIIKPYKTDGPVYIRQQKGFYQRVRKITGFIFVLLFLMLPWLKFQGNQAILLDIDNQKFHIFSQTFFPQDFTLLAWLLLISCFLLFFITTWLGRIWCGYLCPQTVWMFTFVWVEEWIEGTRNQRIKQDKANPTISRLIKKISKHTAWLFLSLVTSLTFLSYFLPVEQLYLDVLQWELAGTSTFWLVFFTFCTYGNAGWLREKMCIYMCPYSRFQSAMFDHNTYLVAYDEKRGENRGSRKRKDDPRELELGDCVDCNLCVDVCPAGIDIRNGLQYECINCGACVDACNNVMDKFNYPKGLISYTSENALLGKKEKMLRPKVLGYGLISLLMLAIMVYSINVRVPLEVSILRDRNALYQVDFNENIINNYLVKVTNKSQVSQNYLIVISDVNREILAQRTITLLPSEMINVPMKVVISPEKLSSKISDIIFVISSIDKPDIFLNKTTKFYSK
jgi:cytochrome c oxidase accessory protein FixG